MLSLCSWGPAASCIRFSALACPNAVELCRSLHNLSQQAPTADADDRCGHQQEGTLKKRSDHRIQSIVFLGTPKYSSFVLDALMQRAAEPDAEFEVSAVVTRPLLSLASVQQQQQQRQQGDAKASSAPGQAMLYQRASMGPSFVEQAALGRGMHPSRILRPPNAKDSAFLEYLESLRPDVCITAAYGCILPQRFLDIPRLGTLNIHPSLLPKYRGAAPVQRALQDGCKVAGVTLAFTVLRCDAGPVVAQQAVEVDQDEQAPELTDRLFALGSQLLMHSLPSILRGTITPGTCTPQDDKQATHASKLSKEQSWLDPSQPAVAVHNHIRAFAGWPGTRLACLVLPERGAAEGAGQRADIKVLHTRLLCSTEVEELLPHVPAGNQAGRCGHVMLVRGRMLLQCGQGTWLEILQARWSGSPRGMSPGATLTGKALMAGLGRRTLTAIISSSQH